jgi:DNA-binding NtrC family response regulator
MIARTPASQLEGRKVLVVEDETLVAIDYCEGLRAAGAQVIGPFPKAAEALKCVDQSDIDVAVLDYALADDTSDPLQVALERRGIPFVVISGYPRVLVRRDEHQNVLSKPVSPETLCAAVQSACR